MEGAEFVPMTKRFTIVLSAVALALAVSSVPARAADAAAGKAVYTSKCQACHAADGAGNQNLAKAMGVTLAPLGGADVQKMSDEDLKKVVAGGKGKMKPIASVTGADLDNVVAYIRTLKK
jgi:cytochrome c6